MATKPRPSRKSQHRRAANGVPSRVKRRSGDRRITGARLRRWAVRVVAACACDLAAVAGAQGPHLARRSSFICELVRRLRIEGFDRGEAHALADATVAALMLSQWRAP